MSSQKTVPQSTVYWPLEKRTKDRGLQGQMTARPEVVDLLNDSSHDSVSDLLKDSASYEDRDSVDSLLKDSSDQLEDSGFVNGNQSLNNTEDVGHMTDELEKSLNIEKRGADESLQSSSKKGRREDI